MAITPPLVSVVIPVFNGVAYLVEAIESVRTQTHSTFDIIVVDDGSTDGTASLANRLADWVRYVRQENAGPAAAMNRGVTMARGQFISFLSADDVWLPEKLAWQVAALSANTKVDAVFGHMQHFISPELSPAEAASLKCPPDPMPAYSAGTLLTKIEIFRAVGLFDETFRVGEFIDWYSRAVDLGLNIEMLPQVVSRRRVHGSNHSLSAKAPQGYARALKAALDRRRN